MNNLHSHIVLDGGVLLVAPIEDLTELERRADERDLRSVADFVSSSRRAERLAWRELLREVEPDASVEYDASGRPQLRNSRYSHISVSHCRDRVAVMLSDAPCGVDIELCSRNFSRISERYIHPDEERLCTEEWGQVALWCAKECLYKLAATEGLSLRDDLRIISLDGEQMVGEVRGGEVRHIVARLRIVRPDSQHLIVYTI